MSKYVELSNFSMLKIKKKISVKKLIVQAFIESLFVEISSVVYKTFKCKCAPHLSSDFSICASRYFIWVINDICTTDSIRILHRDTCCSSLDRPLFFRSSNHCCQNYPLKRLVNLSIDIQCCLNLQKKWYKTELKENIQQGTWSNILPRSEAYHSLIGSTLTLKYFKSPQ